MALIYSRNMKTDGDLSNDRCQPHAPFLSRIGAITLLLVCLAVTGSSRAGPSDEAEVAIQHLLNHVRRSDLVFVRNFNNHSSAEAAEHISEKYDHFREKIATPEDFIDLCASKSLLTGKAYLLVDERGREVATRDWLLIELAAYRIRNSQVGE